MRSFHRVPVQFLCDSLVSSILFSLLVRRHAPTTDSWLQPTSINTFCKRRKSSMLITLTVTGPLSSSEYMGTMPRGATGLSRIELVVCQIFIFIIFAATTSAPEPTQVYQNGATCLTQIGHTQICHAQICHTQICHT